MGAFLILKIKYNYAFIDHILINVLLLSLNKKNKSFMIRLK